MDTHTNETHSVPLVATVLDADLETIRGPQAFFVHEHPTWEVSPGMYAVRVDPPSGQALRKIVSVGEGGSAVAAFDLHDVSGHEILERAAVLRDLDWRPRSSGLDADEYVSVWARLWRRETSGAWQPVRLAAESRWDHRDGVRYVVNLPRNAHLLQVGGPKVAWRHVALPPGGSVSVTIVPDHDRPGELLVSAACQDDAAESLMGYMRAGSLDHAAEVVMKAERLLEGKSEDPCAAAIAGYYLLRLRKLERLSDWASNLCEWFPWMADGAIIDAWWRIHAGRSDQGADQHFDAARRLLITAADRGIPVYTEGLRLLVDGLNLFRADADVATAIDRVHAYADATDWTVATATFAGAGPARPRIRPRYGIPQMSAGIVMLHTVRLVDLVRLGLVEPGTAVRFDRDSSLAGVVTKRGALTSDNADAPHGPGGMTLAAAPGGMTLAAAPANGAPPDWQEWVLDDGRAFWTLLGDARDGALRAEPTDSVRRLGLSPRTANALIAGGLSTVVDVIECRDLREIPGIGMRSVREIDTALAIAQPQIAIRVPSARMPIENFATIFAKGRPPTKESADAAVDAVPELPPPASEKPTSLEFTETMRGFITLGEDDFDKGFRAGKKSKTDLAFHLTILMDDIERFIADEQLPGTITGHVQCEALGGRLEVHLGWFNLLVETGDHGQRKLMKYRLLTQDGEGHPITLRGFKDVKDDPGFDVWPDTSTLFTHIYAGHVEADEDDHADIVASGILHIRRTDFAVQMMTLRVDPPHRLDAIARFGALLAGDLWKVYAQRYDT